MAAMYNVHVSKGLKQDRHAIFLKKKNPEIRPPPEAADDIAASWMEFALSRYLLRTPSEGL
jgi:hypothetical protein